MLDRADAVVALNPPSLARFEAVVATGGLLLVNTSLIEAEPARADIEVLPLPCTGIAIELGDVRLVSIVALGGLLSTRPIVRPASVRESLGRLLAGKDARLVEADIRAFERGLAAAAPVSDPIAEAYA